MARVGLHRLDRALNSLARDLLHPESAAVHIKSFHAGPNLAQYSPDGTRGFRFARSGLWSVLDGGPDASTLCRFPRRGRRLSALGRRFTKLRRVR